MTRAESNRIYYDRTRRKTHSGKFMPLCRQSGPVDKVVTCKTCLMILKTRAVGSKINEWERKRLDAMFRKRTAALSAAWRKRNPDKAREASKRWRDKNRDVLRVLNREWCANNIERRRIYNAQWRSRKAQQASA